MSNDLLTQMDIVSGYAEYIATEEIIYGNYSAPDELLDLLDTLNDTLTSLHNSVSRPWLMYVVIEVSCSSPTLRFTALIQYYVHILWEIDM